MTEKPLNWGLLSTAKINRALFAPLKISKRNQLMAVASRSQEKAEAYAREWNIPRAFGSYDALIRDPDIDVIYNALPNHLHAIWSIKAMKAGKHVLCEKPITLSLEDMDEMIAVSEQTGCVLTEAFMYRHHPQTQRAAEMIRQGVVGDLQFMRGSFRFALTREGNYRFKKEMGGGSIWDIGCYPISYMRLLAGSEPSQVFGWQVEGADDIDMAFVGQMRFSNNLLAQFDSSFRSPFKTEMEVIGSEGTLSIPDPFKPGKRCELILTKNDKVKKVKIRGEALYLGEVEDMADAILLGKKPRISLEDSRANLHTMLVLLQSAEEGQPINL